MKVQLDIQAPYSTIFNDTVLVVIVEILQADDFYFEGNVEKDMGKDGIEILF